jgi:hypothetical protein
VGREEYDAIPGYLASQQWDRKTAGAKVVFLFHPFRRIPLALSQSAQYDFEAGEWRTLTRGEFLGLPSSFDLFPNGRKWRHGRHRLP